MRTTRSLIMRLFVDTENPQALYGVVRSVTDADEWSFANGQELLRLLSEICHEAERPKDEDRRLA